MEGKPPVRIPWFSQSDPQFYHNHDGCHIGQNVPVSHRFLGDGRRRLCPVCMELGARPLTSGTMTDVRRIRGTVHDIAYEAVLKPAEWPVVAGRETEWLVTCGSLAFAVAATHALRHEQQARAAIETELERRLRMLNDADESDEARA